MSFVVGIDGPAGSGKGTVTKIVANRLNLTNVDTGITYRCVALEALNRKIDLQDKESIIKIANEIDIQIQNAKNGDIVFLNGINVTDKIRSKEVSQIVSYISSIKEVRFRMVDLQRELAKGKNVIMEGRDICTYVFPNADVKIYLDASIEERARRRYKEMREKGIETTLEETKKMIAERDKNDMQKEIGALKIDKDSIIVNTTGMTVDEVANKIIRIIKENNKCEL